MTKYEVWGRKRPACKRTRLAFGFSTEAEARVARKELAADGLLDLVVVQRPPRYGRITGLQTRGRDSK